MTEERTRELLNNAISILETRVFDNYETEAMDNLGMTKQEYCDIMNCEEWQDEADDDFDEFEIFHDTSVIKDSMQLDSGETIACMKARGKRASIEVQGAVKVWWNPNVADGSSPTDGEYYNRPSEFPKELKSLILNNREWENDERVYVSENNWFELFVYDSDDDRLPVSDVVDIEYLSVNEIREMLLDAIND